MLQPRETGRIAGKVALVTGAASGLGEAIARRFVAEGARVYLADIDMEGARAVATALGRSATALTLDVIREPAWIETFARIETEAGRLDVLVNSAGVTRVGSVEDLSLETFRELIDVDLISVFLGCKHVVPLMRRTGGSIINVSSIAGLRPRPHLAGYTSVKAAVTMLSKSSALHYATKGYNIRCNALHPGAIHTVMLEKTARQTSDPEAFLAALRSQAPLGRLGVAEEVAAMALFLASDESAFVTGAEMVVDGGTIL